MSRAPGDRRRPRPPSHLAAPAGPYGDRRRSADDPRIGARPPPPLDRPARSADRARLADSPTRPCSHRCCGSGPPKTTRRRGVRRPRAAAHRRRPHRDQSSTTRTPTPLTTRSSGLLEERPSLHRRPAGLKPALRHPHPAPGRGAAVVPPRRRRLAVNRRPSRAHTPGSTDTRGAPVWPPPCNVTGRWPAFQRRPPVVTAAAVRFAGGPSTPSSARRLPPPPRPAHRSAAPRRLGPSRPPSPGRHRDQAVVLGRRRPLQAVTTSTGHAAGARSLHVARLTAWAGARRRDRPPGR